MVAFGLNGDASFQLMKLLMNTSQFEFTLKTLFKRLLDNKQIKWTECEKEAADRMKGAGYPDYDVIGAHSRFSR